MASPTWCLQLARRAVWRFGGVLGAARMSSQVHSDAERIISASISSVDPVELVSKSLKFDSCSRTLFVQGHQYPINKNVKVVAFGKAVLGMVAALERVLNDGDITGGVASVPVGAVDTARKFYPHHLPTPQSKIRIHEGAYGNLPDSASEAAAGEVLAVARSCGAGDLLVALVSGGGSALLSCPVPGVTLQEKREVIESLSRGGADIRELNTVRMAISQTKGGRLAEAARPAKVLGLILSDVIGDPLEIIASGPTVSQTTDPQEVLEIMDKYDLLKDNQHSSVRSYLKSAPPPQHETTPPQHCVNLIIGSNKVAAASAKAAAIELGYTTFVWSRTVEGEASSLGEMYATLAHYITLKQLPHSSHDPKLSKARDELHKCFRQLSPTSPRLENDISNLMRMMEVVVDGDRQPFCLLGAGEPTVRVTGQGKGGRNQELALAFALKLHQLRGEGSKDNAEEEEEVDCLLASVGTDGQDGPHGDAAGAMVDTKLLPQALKQGLDPTHTLLDNDSHTFFSEVNSGRNLVQTGLTGTNVMDIHVLLVR